MVNKIEYALWGTKKGIEDIIRVNGMEVQNNYKKTVKIKEILEKRKEFEKIRIQKINNTEIPFSNIRKLIKKKSGY